MYRVALCEDEACQLQELQTMCKEILTHMDVEHEIHPFASADELGAAFKNGMQFDLLCLDILMAGQTGMELATELRKWDDQTSILFITCSTDYLLEGYTVRPIQYLLKPVQQHDLQKAIQTDLRLNHQPRTISLKIKGKTSILPLSDIHYVESQNHGCVFFTDSGTHFFQINLTEIEALLPSRQFARCHNSFMINMTQIQTVNSREIRLMDGSSLPIGRRYGKDFQSKFVRYLNLGES